MTIDDVYADLKDLIDNCEVQTPGNDVYTIKEKSLVIPLSQLNAESETWGAQFRDAITEQKTRAWFFTQVDDFTEGDSRKERRDHFVEWVLQIHFYMAQRDGTWSDNSDLDFQRECNAVVSSLNRNPVNMPDSLRQVRKFGMRRNYKMLGDESTHFAVGRLFVKSC